MFPRDPISRILSIIHVALIVMLWVIPLLTYDSLPEQIPAHFNLKGEVDSWSSKSTLYLIPIIWTVIGGLIFLLLRYRQAFNYPQKDEIKKLPDEFQKPVHILNRQFVLAIFVVVGAMFAYLEYAIVESARAATSTLSMYAIFTPMGITIVLLIIYLIRMRGVVERAIIAAKRQ